MDDRQSCCRGSDGRRFLRSGNAPQYETSRRARVEAVSNAVRLVARRSYEKDAKKLINRKEISTAYEEFPIVCTPL